MQEITDKEILITGGTGSLGSTLTQLLLREHAVRGIRIYSRDENKQWEMARKITGGNAPVSYILGDVRDKSALQRAADGVDAIIHTAALKHVPACEYNPLEAVHTNVSGAENVISAALHNGVQRVVNISTDKAVNPINLYGATKLCAEKLFTHASVYAGARDIRFVTCRYGNVLASRGSVAHVFRAQTKRGEPLTITDPRMTRFWVTLPRVARFIARILRCALNGGEIFVPGNMASMSLIQMARILGGTAAQVEIIGVRAGEKLHETILSGEEYDKAIWNNGVWIVPATEGADTPYWVEAGLDAPPEGLTSKNNPNLLTEEKLKSMLEEEI